MTARIARGGGAYARSRPKSRKAAPRGRRKRSPELLELFGFPPGTGRRLRRWLITATLIVAAVAAVLFFRLPQLAGLAIGEGIGKAGFTLRHVEVTGRRHVPADRIYNVADGARGEAMPLVDIGAIRRQLLTIGWIRDVRVSRRLPDTLVIDVIERRPAAIWQDNGLLSLIDADGVVLEPVRLDHMPDLPLLVGPAANRHVVGLTALFEAAPQLRAQISGATWIGERRWDIHFQSGETLSLPEGDDEARRALLRFAALDQQQSLLGRGFARIDMRDPRRAYIRISREPGTVVPSQAPPPDPGQLPQDLSRTI